MTVKKIAPEPITVFGILNRKRPPQKMGNFCFVATITSAFWLLEKETIVHVAHNVSLGFAFGPKCV
jgi:hypothetical protein